MRQQTLRRILFLVGIVGAITFVATGVYMDRSLDHLVGMPDGPRALYRSAHIYILFSALLNASLGLYFAQSETRAARILQYLGSAMVVASLAFFVYGFVVETPRAEIERPIVRDGIYLSLGGVILHVVAAIGMVSRRAPSSRPTDQHTAQAS